MKSRSFLRAATLCGVAALGLSLGVSSANAETLSGWVGPTPPVNGNLYLHQSSISNTPLTADTRMYTAFGYAVPAYTIGVRTRLFKSGALCVINPVKFNSSLVASVTDPTTGDCGPGWYNSHGFALADTGSNYSEFVTFPTDPLQWGQTTAAPPAPVQVRTDDQGRTFGSAENVESDADLPDFILSYGTDGTLGYIAASDLPSTPKTREEVLAAPREARGGGTEVLKSSIKTVPLYDESGTNKVGEFRIGG